MIGIAWTFLLCDFKALLNYSHSNHYNKLSVIFISVTYGRTFSSLMHDNRGDIEITVLEL